MASPQANGRCACSYTIESPSLYGGKLLSREHAELTRLANESESLKVRIPGLARKQERLLRKPLTVNSPLVREQLGKATSLATYVEFPIDTTNEINQVLVKER